MSQNSPDKLKKIYSMGVLMNDFYEMTGNANHALLLQQLKYWKTECQKYQPENGEVYFELSLNKIHKHFNNTSKSTLVSWINSLVVSGFITTTTYLKSHGGVSPTCFKINTSYIEEQRVLLNYSPKTIDVKENDFKKSDKFVHEEDITNEITPIPETDTPIPKTGTASIPKTGTPLYRKPVHINKAINNNIINKDIIKKNKKSTHSTLQSKKKTSLSQKWSVDASGERYYIDKTTNRPVYARDVEEEPIKEVRVVSSSDSFYPVEHVLNREDPSREEVLSILESMKKIGGTDAKGMLPHLQPILSKALAVFNSKCADPTITFDCWSAFYSQIFSKFSTCKVHSRKWNGLEHKVKTGVVVSTFFEYMMKYMSAISGFDEEAKSIPKYLENCETKNGDFLIDNVNGRMNKLIETGFTSEKHMRALKQFDAKGTLRGFKYAGKSNSTPSVLNMQVVDDRRAGINQCNPLQRGSRS